MSANVIASFFCYPLADVVVAIQQQQRPVPGVCVYVSRDPTVGCRVTVTNQENHRNETETIVSDIRSFRTFVFFFCPDIVHARSAGTFEVVVVVCWNVS